MSFLRRKTNKRFFLGVGLVVACVLGVYCESSSTTPGLNPAVLGLCSFPRACYLVRKTGALAGQCDSCAGGPGCRLVYKPGESDRPGTWTPTDANNPPSAREAAAICGAYVPTSPDLEARCLVPEADCVARGPDCPTTGFCVPEGKSCDDANVSFPQHQTGGGKTACPFEKSRCCTPSTDAGTGDAGLPISDGGASDLSSSDAGLAG